MKSVSVILAISLVTSVYAQEACVAVAAKVPSCAANCIEPAAQAVGCELTDFACQCSSSQSAAIASSALPCVVSACGAVTGLAVQSAAADVCACAATAASVPASTTSEAPTTSATSSAESTPTSSAEPAPTSSTTASTASLPHTTAPPFPNTTGGGAAAPTGTAHSGIAPGGSKAPSSSAIPFTGGAAQIVCSASAVLGALLVAVWAL